MSVGWLLLFVIIALKDDILYAILLCVALAIILGQI